MHVDRFRQHGGERRLPAAAPGRPDWPVRLDHCFARILLDNACGATASLTVDDTGLRPFLTISLTIDFIAAGRAGGVTATGRVTGGGRSLLFVAGELLHDDGTLIATASGVSTHSRVRSPPRNSAPATRPVRP